MATLKASTDLGYGVLTTDHAASSYGQPVVVIDGQAFGPAEIESVNVKPLGEDDVEEIALVEAARIAGYAVYC